MNAEIQLKWTERLGEDLGNGRCAFYAELTPPPDETWRKCFHEVVRAYEKHGPFQAGIEHRPTISYAVVIGRLVDFETKLSIELESAVSETNRNYERALKQQALERSQADMKRMEEEKLRKHLIAKFVRKDL